MVETLCHSAMTSVPPVVAAGSGLYFVPARSTPFEGTGVGLPGAAAEPAAGADAAASLEDGPAVCPHALATRATTPKRATRRFCDICDPFHQIRRHELLRDVRGHSGARIGAC